MDVNVQELERWRGGVDSTLADHERRLQSINGSIARSASATQNLTLEVAKFTSRIGVMVTVAGGTIGFLSAIGSGVTVYFLTRR